MKIRVKNIRKLLIASAIFISYTLANAQQGYPYVSPFSFDETIGTENFDVIQDNHFNILIANRKGILIFDSRKWNLLPLPYFPLVLSKSPVDGTIYAGCRNGFGYLEQDLTGGYNYQLLSDTIITGEISSIEINSNREFFISRNRIYYSAGVETGIKYWEFPFENKISGSFIFKDEFYFMLYDKGLFKAVDDTFKLVLSDRFSMRSELVFTSRTSSNDLLAGSSNNELYLYSDSGFSSIKIKDSEYLAESVITDGVYLGDNKLAVSSLLGGVLICDYKTGLSSSILNYNTGMPDDEIYCLGTDISRGLWLCHSFGVSRVDNKLNVANMTWYPGLKGSLTNSAFFRDQLYIGTSDGLYVLQEKREYDEKMVYVKIPANSKANISSTNKTSNSSAKESTAQISQDNYPVEALSRKKQRRIRREPSSASSTSTKVEDVPEQGFLNKIISSFESSDRSSETKTKGLSGTINKKKIYSLQSISHAFEKIQGVSGKCTEIISIKDHLLVSTNNGLYDIRNNKSKAILPDTYISFINPGPGDSLLFAGSEESVYILLLKDNQWEVVRELDALDYPVYSACMPTARDLWLGSDNTVHKLTIDTDYFVDADESFLITSKFSDRVIIRNINNQLYFFLSSGIYRMEDDVILPYKSFDNLYSLPGYYFSNNNVVWYRSEGRWNFIADSLSQINLPIEYLNIFKSVQDIYLGSGGNLWIIANSSEIFKVMNDAAKMDSGSFTVFFSGLKSTDGQQFPLTKPKISYKKSSLRIEFSAPFYLAPGKTEFQYRIKGLNTEWSLWSSNSVLDYPLIPPGVYTIDARARNIFGYETEIRSLSFVIKPPFWRTTIFYILVILLTLTLFGLIIKVREQSLMNAKLILEQKVTERTAEIERQKNEISDQKKEITDSIFYARRIQTAVLPSPSMLNSVLSEHFVLFLPRDIVSGDFYWSTVKGDKIVILAADCTGHGVPGAFMSMLGVSFLNEIVSTHKLDDAADILNILRDHIKTTLSKSGDTEKARDGMDIALCIIDQKKKKLLFAGAYNPLYMIRKGILTEIKGDKMPIGLYDLDKGFLNNSLNINKGDCFYIFSDGYIDQFGGKFEKKFLSKPFKELLLKIHHQTMNKQKEMLVTTFQNWKGENQQVDDVLIIGFRI